MRRFLLIDDTKYWEDREVLDISLMMDDKPKKEQYPDVEFHEVRNFDAGITALKQGNWDAVYLDWDLGSGDDKTGHQIITFLRDNPEFMPKEIKICSGHPDHARMLTGKARNLYRRLEKEEA